MAGAVAMGYSNIFVTAPSPENLNTLFEFVFKGLDAMDYKVRRLLNPVVRLERHQITQRANPGTVFRSTSTTTWWSPLTRSSVRRSCV
jgi:tRNA(Met) C34 N-acetyltransferase TmcA